MNDRRSEGARLNAWMERHPFCVMLAMCLAVWCVVVALFVALVWSDGE